MTARGLELRSLRLGGVRVTGTSVAQSPSSGHRDRNHDHWQSTLSSCRSAGGELALSGNLNASGRRQHQCKWRTAPPSNSQAFAKPPASGAGQLESGRVDATGPSILLSAARWRRRSSPAACFAESPRSS
jgi:hypothetical protein